MEVQFYECNNNTSFEFPQLVNPSSLVTRFHYLSTISLMIVMISIKLKPFSTDIVVIPNGLVPYCFAYFTYTVCKVNLGYF